jgi:type II secretory pathway pseudopilin PulG
VSQEALQAISVRLVLPWTLPPTPPAFEQAPVVVDVSGGPAMLAIGLLTAIGTLAAAAVPFTLYLLERRERLRAQEQAHKLEEEQRRRTQEALDRQQAEQIYAWLPNSRQVALSNTSSGPVFDVVYRWSTNLYARDFWRQSVKRIGSTHGRILLKTLPPTGPDGIREKSSGKNAKVQKQLSRFSWVVRVPLFWVKVKSEQSSLKFRDAEGRWWIQQYFRGRPVGGPESLSMGDSTDS